MKSLHRLIPDSQLPTPLRRKLVFGDKEQIDALNALEADIEIKATELAKVESGELKYFEVCIAWAGKQNIKILAVDAEDARKKAREVEADMDDADVEIDYVNAREIKTRFLFP